MDVAIYIPGNNLLMGIIFVSLLSNMGINNSNITFLGIYFVTVKQQPPN
jgi:hypothetical protein